MALYRKFGFIVEGTGKQYALRNGEYVDAYFMARLKVTVNTLPAGEGRGEGKPSTLRLNHPANADRMRRTACHPGQP